MSRTDNAQDILRLDHVSLAFGGVQVLRDVSVALRAGEVLALIGPNGAGKSALLNCIMGTYRPEARSEIRLQAQRIDGWPPHRIARLGIGRTFQGLKLLRELSVLENILLGWTPRYTLGALGSLALPWRTRAEEREARRRTFAIAEQCGLQDALDARCGELPLGVLRRVDLARALIRDPAVLLLDEPASGLSHDERPLIGELVQIACRDARRAVVWIEHDLDLVLTQAHRAVVLHHGAVITTDDPATPDGRARLLKAYRQGSVATPQ